MPSPFRVEAALPGVQWIDKGFRTIADKIRLLRFLELTIGFQGDEGMKLYPNGVNVATIATYQEFGTDASAKHPGIPARPYLRAAMFEYRDKIRLLWAAGYEKLIATKSFTPEDMLAQIGRGIVALVERKIDRAYSWAKANAPSTVKNKGFDYPLHETDLMARSVTWAVRNKIGSILATGGSHG